MHYEETLNNLLVHHVTHMYYNRCVRTVRINKCYKIFYYILLIFRNVQYTICLLLGQFDYYEACVVLFASVYEMNDEACS